MVQSKVYVRKNNNKLKRITYLKLKTLILEKYPKNYLKHCFSLIYKVCVQFISLKIKHLVNPGLELSQEND